MPTLTHTQQTLLGCVSAGLSGEKYNTVAETDFAAVINEGRKQAVCALALCGIGNKSETAEFSDRWDALSLAYMRKSLVVFSCHNDINIIMKKNCIPYCILKGCSSAYYYRDPFSRAMGDTDVIVDSKSISRADKALVENGYSFVSENVNHRVYHKGEYDVELHIRPTGVPAGAAGELINGYLTDIYEKSEEAVVGNFAFVKPCDFHHGLIILLHTCHHLIYEGVGIRHLCDFGVFADRLSDEEFRRLFEDKLKRAGLWHFAAILGKTCAMYLGTATREWMNDADENICRELMNDIMSGGNFGIKDSTRRDQGKMISGIESNEIGKSKYAQFARNVLINISDSHPFLKKHKLLLPFAAVPLGIRYFFRMLAGKRKNPKLAKIMTRAEERKNIYKKLNLFSADK